AASAAHAGVPDEAILAKATTAVRAAEASVQARPGQVGALALSRLALAKRQLSAATASADPAEVQQLAGSALGVAEQVHTLIKAPAAAGSSRASSSASTRALGFASPSSSGRSSDWRRTTAA